MKTSLLGEQADGVSPAGADQPGLRARNHQWILVYSERWWWDLASRGGGRAGDAAGGGHLNWYPGGYGVSVS